MNRRNLLNLAAVTATAAVAAAAGPASANPATPAAAARPARSAFANARHDHVAIRVRNFEAAVSWYKSVLGFEEEVRWEAPPHVGGGLKLNYLRLNDIVLEVVGDGDAPQPGRAQPNSIPELFGVHGYNHLCLRVADIEAAKAELEAKGVPVYAGPNVNRTLDRAFIHFRDFEGIAWELVQYRS